MCEALRELMKDDLEKREQETLLKTIKNLMDTTKWTVEQVMAAMKIPEIGRASCRERV